MYEYSIFYSIFNFLLFIVMFFTGGNGVTYDDNYLSTKSKAIDSHRIKLICLFANHLLGAGILNLENNRSIFIILYYISFGIIMFTNISFAHRDKYDVDSGVFINMSNPIIMSIQLIYISIITPGPLFTFCNSWPCFCIIGVTILGGGIFTDWDRINILRCPWTIATTVGLLFTILPTWIFLSYLHIDLFPEYVKFQEMVFIILTIIIIIFTISITTSKVYMIAIGPSVINFNQLDIV